MILARLFVPLLAMKVLLFLGLFIITETTLSQTTDGYILYNIEVTAIDSSLENQQAAGLLQGSKMELYWAVNKSRLDFKMGELYSTTMTLDHTTNLILMLYKGMNGQSAALNAFDETQIAQPTVDTDMVVTLVKETKRILGYNCKKAITVLGDVETMYWYTDEINIVAVGQEVVNPNVPGFPMYFSTVLDGVFMEYQVSSLLLDEVQPDTVFATEVPEGYSIQK
jgi:hypothetical protein